MKTHKLLATLLLITSLFACGEVTTQPTVVPSNPTSQTTTTAKPTTAKPTTQTPTTVKPTTETPVTSINPGECKHTDVRTGILKATSLTTGSKIEVCNICGHENVTTLPLDESNSGVLTSSGEDKELNYMDLVRGIYGDAKLTFTFKNETPAENGDWAVGRAILLTSETAPFTATNEEIYGKGMPMPGNAGSYNGADKMYFYGWNGEHESWFPGAFVDHAKDMDVTVTVTRIGELASINVVGKCNLHENEYNENNSSYYIQKDKPLNVVLGTTFAKITLKSASLDLTFNESNEMLSAPIVKTPTSNDGSTYNENVVYTHMFDNSYYQKVTMKFNEKDSVSKDDNQWGHWRGYFWRTNNINENGEMLLPYPDATNNTNGSVYTRLTPTQDHYTDWNGMQPKINFEGGMDSEDIANGNFSWFTSTDPNFVDNFGDLMNDVDVTLTIVKVFRFFFFTFEYSSNVYENTTAFRYFGGGTPIHEAAFTLCQERSTLTLNSVTVEKF